MRAQLIHEHNGEKTFVLVFDKGEEVVAGLHEFATRQHIAAAHLTAVGAFHDVRLGYFERARKDYKHISLREQVEVLALVGNIALAKGQPKLHAHVVVGEVGRHSARRSPPRGPCVADAGSGGGRIAPPSAAHH